MNIILRAVTALCMSSVIMLLCGCETAGYTKKNLQTTNGADGWICTFDELDGEYTNAFPINSNTIRITSSVEGGAMDVVLSANGVTKTFNGADMDEFIPVDEFGEGNLYISFDADDAVKGRVRVIWTQGDDNDDAGGEDKNTE